MIICVQYCVISLISTVSLIYFIVVTNRSAEHTSELLFYKLTMGFAALCSFTDIMYALREFCRISLGTPVNYFIEILYSLGSICGSYCWFIYSEKKQWSPVSASQVCIRLFSVPFALMSLFTITTPLHRLCFSLSGLQYVRGILNVPFTVVCSAFIVFSGITALIRSYRKKYHSRAVLLRLLFLYTVFLILAQVLQVVAGPILPFRSLSAAVIFMVITLRGMSETVTVDALSQINNRFALDRALDKKIFDSENFWLMMLDIDDFKHINDTYGHIYGDRAISYTASAITRAVPHNYFVARYGGDEFAVVAPFGDESVISQLEDKIRTELNILLQENACPFTMDITSGYTQRDEKLNTIPDIVEAADKILYERKRMKKAGRTGRKG